MTLKDIWSTPLYSTDTDSWVLAVFHFRYVCYLLFMIKKETSLWIKKLQADKWSWIYTNIFIEILQLTKHVFLKALKLFSLTSPQFVVVMFQHFIQSWIGWRVSRMTLALCTAAIATLNLKTLVSSSQECNCC